MYPYSKLTNILIFLAVYRNRKRKNFSITPVSQNICLEFPSK